MGAGRSAVPDSQRRLEVGGEFFDRRGDLHRLLVESVGHSFCGLGFAADQLQRRHHEREVVVDVMAHGGEALVQFLNLRAGECGGRTGSGSHGCLFVGFCSRNRFIAERAFQACKELVIRHQLAKNLPVPEFLGACGMLGGIASGFWGQTIFTAAEPPEAVCTLRWLDHNLRVSGFTTT